MARAKGSGTGVQEAEIVREYGPLSEKVGGVTFDGTHVWFAAGDTLRALDPSSGREVRAIDVAADAGTAFDGRYLYQIAEARIQKIDPATGEVRLGPTAVLDVFSERGPVTGSLDVEIGRAHV